MSTSLAMVVLTVAVIVIGHLFSRKSGKRIDLVAARKWPKPTSWRPRHR